MTALLTIADFQRCYKVSRSTVYRLRGKGAITFVHIGRSVRIPREEAERWYEALLNGAND